MPTSKWKNIGFIGFGRSNIGVLEYLDTLGDFSYTLRSDKETAFDKRIGRCFFGADALFSLDEDVLFISPAVRRDRAELVRARERGVILSSDAELFFEKESADVFATTGSSGKSTTTKLISLMLTASGINAPPAGNFGKSLCSLIGKYPAVAAELSSFQLMYMKPRTKRAVITNVTPNHLDWHKSIDEYVGAKLNIAQNTDALIFDYDSELLSKSINRSVFCLVSSRHSFSELRSFRDAENYMTFKDGIIYLNGSPYIDTALAIRREGYNIKNFMLASAAVLGVCDSDSCKRVISTFRGLPHRAETVLEKNGVRFINSSIDTSPERTVETLLSQSGRTAVILCGKNKGLSLQSLADALPTLTVGAVLMGEIGDELSMLLAEKDYRTAFAKSFDEAIAYALDILGGEGNVILSPAGTSFDRFDNFEKRGESFCEAAKRYDK